MKLDKSLFDSIAAKAAQSPRLRMHYDLRDSEKEDGQRMLNVLLPGTKSAIHRHTLIHLKLSSVFMALL